MGAALPKVREFQPEDVEETGRVIGRGSYGKVVELKIQGLRCAGKKLHEDLYLETSFEDRSAITTRFIEEWNTHSELSHPNIVQFIGVYISPGSTVPTLILELMPISLANALQQYKNIINHVKNGILLDVAVGLRFLHGQIPPIIHRDLTANNVLLSEGVRAKICDLGVAKIVGINPAQMTTVPGTPCYMPPEAFLTITRYDTKLDVFSFGNLIIHVAIQEWPIPKMDMHRPHPDRPGEFVPVTEIERRKPYLDQMGESRALTSLASRCLQNDTRLRPTAAEIVLELEKLVSDSPTPFINSLAMLKQNEDLQTKVEDLEAAKKHLELYKTHLNPQVESLMEQIELLTQENTHLCGTVRTKASQIQSLHQRVDNLYEDQALQQKTRAIQQKELATKSQQIEKKVVEIESQKKLNAAQALQIQSMAAQIKAKDSEVAALRQQVSSINTENSAIGSQVHFLQQEIALQKEIFETKCDEITNQKQQISATENELAAKSAEISSKDHLLEDKERMIHALRKEVESLRQQQSPTIKPTSILLEDPDICINWTPGKDLPGAFAEGTAVLVHDVIYAGGGSSESTIYRYDYKKDTWSSFSALRHKFALVSHNNHLVVVGGLRSTGNTCLDTLAQWDKRRGWVEPFSPMHAVRVQPTAVSSQRCLAVAGGKQSLKGPQLDSVEVLCDNQWHMVTALPAKIDSATSVILGNKWYIGNGLDRAVYCTSLTSLAKAIKGDEQNVWETLPEMPIPRATLASFSGCILAIGGTSTYFSSTNAVYIYFPPRKIWLPFEKTIPLQMYGIAAVAMPSGELLLVGGCSKVGTYVNVYKGNITHVA